MSNIFREKKASILMQGDTLAQGRVEHGLSLLDQETVTAGLYQHGNSHGRSADSRTKR